MPVPKRKRSRARRDKRFANKGLAIKTIASCPQCKEPNMPHQACAGCGYYKGRKVLTTKLDRSVVRTEVRKKTRATSSNSQDAERTERDSAE